MVRWNGSTWSEFGSLSHPSAGDGRGNCYALCHYQGHLYAGGWFNAIGNLDAWALARHNGSSWEAVGGDPFTAFQSATSLCVHEGKLAVNGELYIDLGNGVQFINTGLWSPEHGWEPLGYGSSSSRAMLSMGGI